MLTRKYLQNELRCPCDRLLSDYELENYREFDGLCEECYTEAMSAAYDDDTVKGLFDDDILNIDIED